MTSNKHTHSIHIDAPVKKVFYYLEDPAHFIAGMPWESHGTHATAGAVHRTPEGVVASYENKLGGKDYVFTREEYVVNERIVDHSSLGVVFTWTFEPDATGTTLTGTWDASTLMKLLDAVFFHSDKDAERAMATFKREVEALS
jgi:Polyketide cyclase / dehydrase and lipid transport